MKQSANKNEIAWHQSIVCDRVVFVSGSLKSPTIIFLATLNRHALLQIT